MRISRDMTVPEVSLMVSNIFKWLFLAMIPINAGILFVMFYKKNLLFYDTLIFSIHFNCILLIFYSIMISELLFLSSINIILLRILLLLNVILVILSLVISIKRVFNFNWISTSIRLLIAFFFSFTFYQLVHYTISLNSGR